MTAAAGKRLIWPVIALLPFLLSDHLLGWTAHTYTASGLLLQVDSSRKTILVSCRNIPGYMDAMTMPFHVRDWREIEGFQPGMMVEFKLVVEEGSSYVKGLRIHSFQSLEQEPLESRRLALMDKLIRTPDSTPITMGQVVPDFTLMDQLRHRVSLSEFSGKVVAITFIYTTCPLPDYCFRLSNNFGRLQVRFRSRLGRDLVLLSITFDPAHDQPEVLADYARTWHADAAGWHFLTGAVPEVQKVCRMFDMNFWPDEGVITHSMHTVLLDRERKMIANLEGNEFTSQQLGDLVATVLDQNTSRQKH